MVQLAPPSSLEPQLFAKTNDDASAPVTVMLPISSVAPPVLVSVTDCDALVDPTCWLAKDKLLAERDTAGGVAPVPLREIDCGELDVLSVMVTAAVREPVAAGVKWPWIVQFAPAATLAPQLFANRNEEASAPVTPILDILTATAPVLVKVICFDAVVAPISSAPNATLDDESEIVVPPVPVSAIDCGEPAASSAIVTAAVIAPPAVGAKCP